MNQKTKRRKTMSKKTQFTRSKNKIGMGFTRKEVSEITGLGHQLISDYYIKYKNKYEK